MAMYDDEQDPMEQEGLRRAVKAPGLYAPAPTDPPKLDSPEVVDGPGATPAPPPVDGTGTPDYKSVGKYMTGQWKGTDEKFSRPWDDRSERYKMLTVLSNFDPKAGITPEVLAALNGANIHGAKFSGSGDKLTVDNAGGYDRFGTGGTADIIPKFKTGEATEWTPWQVDAPGQAAPGPMPTFPMNATSLINSGEQAMVPEGTDFYQKLLEQVQAQLGGPQNLDQRALLNLIGAQ